VTDIEALMCKDAKRTAWRAAVGAALLVGMAATFPQQTSGHGGGGAGETGTATHQHLDTRFSHNRYYYDRGYAVHKPPAGGLADLIGREGERYYFHAGNWFRWRGEWYRCWGGAWVVVDAPVGMLVPELPPDYTTLWLGGTPYYYANDTYYLWEAGQKKYRVVGPPAGAKPAGAAGRS